MSEHVLHNRKQRRFEVSVGSELATLAYREDGAVWHLHTWVPPRARGRGVAEQLATKALQTARDEAKIVVPNAVILKSSFVGTLNSRI